MPLNFLSDNFTNWESIVAAHGSTALKDKRSAKNVDRILSLAGSRKSQRTLCSIVEPHISDMLTDSSGCKILTSLINYGTKATVATLAPLVVANTDMGDILTPFQAELFSSILRRNGAAPETEKDITKNIKNISKNVGKDTAIAELFATILATESTWGKFNKEITQYLTKASITKALLFVENLIADLKIGGGVVSKTACEYLWSVNNVKSNGAILRLLCSRTSEQSLVDEIANHITKQLESSHNKYNNSNFLEAVPELFIHASDKAASSLKNVLLSKVKSFSESQFCAPALAAMSHRYPSALREDLFVAAVATKWDRAHVPSASSTRKIIQATIQEKKRAREQPDGDKSAGGVF